MTETTALPQSAAQAAARAAATKALETAQSATQAAGKPAASGLGSLATNYQTFLKMLTTQLQNQDPTSPMDSSQFTSELVQFSSVEQQIQTNSSLGQLIQLTQGNAVLQSSQLLGKQVELESPELSLQDGVGVIHFTTAQAGPVAIAVYDDAGHPVLAQTIAATQGANSWTWDGADGAGLRRPDGAYRVGVAQEVGQGAAATLAFTVLGRATGVKQANGGVQLQVGRLQLDMSHVVSVGG